VTRVTTTVHSAADALGSAAMPRTASVAAAVTTPTISLRLLLGDAVLLPRLALDNFVCVLRRSRQPGFLLAARASFTTERLPPEATA
jgi:hypothetical protein